MATKLATWRRRAACQKAGASFVAICFSVPALAGYTYLILRGYRLDNNSSYNAYKLLSVFYPGVLAVACYWVTLGRQDGPALVILRAAMIFVVSAFTLNSAHTFSVRLRNPPLMVTPDLVQLREVEAMPAVTSIDVRFPDVWSRLWANVFLLRKPQYFQTETYEGRRRTPLRGEWDLNGGLVQLDVGDPPVGGDIDAQQGRALDAQPARRGRIGGPDLIAPGGRRQARDAFVGGRLRHGGRNGRGRGRGRAAHRGR
jgi:hypothetical protein